MFSHHKPAIVLGASSKNASLSKDQKTFERLIKQIDQKRQKLAAWETMSGRYQKKYTEEMLPLKQQFEDLQWRMVQRMDHSHGQKGLTRKDRHTLSDLIVQLVDGLLVTRDDPELKAIYQRHRGSDYDADLAEDQEMAKQMTREMLEEMLGIELGDDFDFDLDDPEEALRQAQSKLHEKLKRETAEQTAKRSRRKKTAKQTAREAAEEAREKDISDTLRAVYRKLASALHPDREPDPLERERKHVLMQRANIAYEKRNLLQLLEIQLEMEHIDAASLRQISEDRLRHYNAILKEQARELDEELIHVESDFLLRFQIDALGNTSPEFLLRGLDVEIVNMKHALRDGERDLLAFENIHAVKSFLRALRKEQRESDRMFEDDFPF